MIRISAVLRDGFTQLTVDGHEDHAADGQVCAAITAITQAALLGLEQYALRYPNLVSIEILGDRS